MKQASPARVSRLRQWRDSKGFTLDEVSGLCGLSPTYLSRLERGERKLGPDKKVEISRRLGAKVIDLFDIEPLVDEVDS